MRRRNALRIITLAAMAPAADAVGGAHCGLSSETEWTPGNYKLQFFTLAENNLVDQLAEMIIPADAHSPGAHAAQVSLFADLMVATSDHAVQDQWRNGLRLMQESAAKSTLADALAQAAAHEGPPASEWGNFFVALKQMTVNGYYTSKIGIDQDLQFIGNTYIASFPGCDPLI